MNFRFGIPAFIGITPRQTDRGMAAKLLPVTKAGLLQREGGLGGQGILARKDLWVVAALYVLAAGLRLGTGPALIDDAYITFRFAHNAAQGLGLVYNEGERVLGFSTPLWTLLLSLSARAGIDLPSAGFLLGSLCDAALPPLLYDTGRRVGWRVVVALVPALGYLWHPLTLALAVSGMETGLFMLLVVLAGYLYVRERLLGTLVVAGLAAITRLEGCVLLALALYYVWCRGLLKPSFVLVVLAVTAPWYLFATFYFGSPVPQTLLAKAMVYQDQLSVSLSHLQSFILHTVGVPAGVRGEGGIVWLAVPLLALLPIVLVSQKKLAPLVIFHFTTVAGLAIAFAAHRLVFYWYLAPTLPGILLGLAGAAAGRRHEHILAATAGIALLGSALMGYAESDRGPLWRSPVWLPGSREAAYREVAAWLAPQLTTDTLVATNDIGVLGYWLPVRLLDTLGLVTPEAVPYHRGARLWGDIPAALIAHRKPDYVVAQEVFVQHGLLEDSVFHRDYVLVGWWPGPGLGGFGAVLVFQRQPAAP